MLLSLKIDKIGKLHTQNEIEIGFLRKIYNVSCVDFAMYVSIHFNFPAI